ncbi:MAG: NUDIX hydrolase [Parachlamydia sp.]|jgi:8-oxo-dGTP pyrophosphatase MutT (NUDIX family)|nr:NUDIX hydrolase [Parachlamydia sp.]
MYTIYNHNPPDFSPTVEAAGCYIQHNNKLLFLKRHPATRQGGTWGVPAGKIEENEKADEAVVREVFEETGIDLSGLAVQEVGKLFITLHDELDYIYHMFTVTLSELPALNIAIREHTEAKWVTYEEALELQLMKAAKESLIHFYNKK